MLALLKTGLAEVATFLSENATLKESLTDAKRELKMYKYYRQDLPFISPLDFVHSKF